MENLFERFDRLDTSLNHWLVAHSIALLRISLGFVYLAFGALKFFPGLSPAADLAARTTTALTFGVVPPGVGLAIIAALEVAIGLCFVSGRFLRVGVWLMGFQLLGAMSPLVLFTGELFSGPLHMPTLVAQYIIKDIVLVAAGMVIASTWTGARIVAERRSMRSTLGARAPRLSRGDRGTAVLTGLEIEKQGSPEDATGTAYFKTEGDYDPQTGEIEESTKHYRQKVTLEPREDYWKVKEVSNAREEA